MITVSFSELFSWDICPRQYYYSNVLNLRPVKYSDAVNTGIKGHKLLQDFYTCMQNGMSKEEALDHMTEVAGKRLEEESAPDFSLLTAWTLITNFVRATTFTAENLLVENRFLVPASKLTDDPFFEDVQIGFTPDLVLKRKGNFIAVEDAKFVQKAWSQGKIDMFPQTKLYQILLNLIGYNVTSSSIRFFNVTTSKITNVPLPFEKEEEATLIRDILGAIKEIVTYRKQPQGVLTLTRRTMNYNECTYCWFKIPCKWESQGKNVSKTLEHEYVKSDYDYNT